MNAVASNFDEPDRAPAPDETLAERLTAFVSLLETEAKRRVDRRNVVEQRWLEDLRQYHGVYPPDVARKLQENKTSQVFLNLTRPKTDAMMARLWDLLFPTDDRNWSIEPTPVPDMVREAEAAMKEEKEAAAAADQSNEQAAQAAEDGQHEAQETLIAQAEEQEGKARAARQAYEALFAIQEEAKRRSDLMQEQIDDQLRTCRFQAEARDMIEDGCKIGMGVLKAPVTGHRRKQTWRQVTDGDRTFHVLEQDADDMPAAHWVDPWSFFPDPEARTIDDSDGFYERHLMTKAQMRKLAKRPDMDKDAIREILRSDARTSVPSYMTELVDLTGQNNSDLRDLYTVWEFTGQIDAEALAVLRDSGVDGAEEVARQFTIKDSDEIDPLAEINARIWFCEGRVLSFALHQLDSGEPIYSVFNLCRDETSLFGYGIPYLMRDPQAFVNSAIRMMMDNGALATGPQIVVNRNLVEPEDGQWKMRPRKVWVWKDGAQAAPNAQPFQTFNIDMHQAELANIIEIGRALIDEMTSMPQIAQGEQGSGVTKTAQGMALLMNSANVVFRRVVRNFDDDVTIPTIRRFYHWNMQFSERDEIKGDYDVVARGSSVLLVREMQAQNLMMIALQLGDHPRYGRRIDEDKILEQLLKAQTIGSVDILRSPADQRKFDQEQAKNVPPEQQAAMVAAQAKMQELELRKAELAQARELSQMEWDARMAIAQMQNDLALEKIASAVGMKREELQAKLEDMAQRRDADERRLATEVGMARQTGKSAGGAV